MRNSLLARKFKTNSIDPTRIGVAGSSAGGHLAELVATTGANSGLEGDGGWRSVSSRVQAVAAYYGVSNLAVSAAEFPRDTDRLVVKLLRSTERESPELYRKASPIIYVSRGDPPLLLAHGKQDDVVPFDQSARMALASQLAGLPVEFVEVENAGHNFDSMGKRPISPSVDVIHQKTIDFFKRYLVSNRAVAKPN